MQLQAALVHPLDERIPKAIYPIKRHGMLNGLPWELVQQSEVAVSVLGKENSAIAIQEKSFAALKVLWGTPRFLHTLVCQGGTSQGIDYQINDNVVTLTLTFSDPADVDDNENNQEVSFYLDESAETQVSVEGVQATTFKLGEELQIRSQGCNMVLCFELALGMGDFVGHIMKSNRPSQLSSSGAHRFTVYDWQIFLRTLSRSEECTIKVTLRLC